MKLRGKKEKLRKSEEEARRLVNKYGHFNVIRLDYRYCLNH